MMNVKIEEKMTKKNWFAILSDLVEESTNNGIISEDVSSGLEKFISHEVELLSKKHSSTSKAGKKNAENEHVKELILASLGDKETGVQVSTLAKEENLKDFSSQKISALISQLVKDGKVKREVVKRVAFFSLSD